MVTVANSGKDGVLMAIPKVIAKKIAAAKKNSSSSPSSSGKKRDKSGKFQ